MSKIVQFRPSGEVPRPMPMELLNLVKLLHSKLMRETPRYQPFAPAKFLISPQFAPSEADRQRLDAHLQQLDYWLRPATEIEASNEIVKVIRAMPLQKPEPELAKAAELAKATLEAFMVGLKGRPLFAIKAACEAALRGKVGASQGRFRPTPAEMALAVEREVQFFLRERTQIAEILSAEIEKEKPPETVRRKMAGDVAALLAGLKNARSPNEIARGFAQTKAFDDGLTPKERAEKRLEELRGQPLPQLSDRALALFKRNDVAAE